MTEILDSRYALPEAPATGRLVSGRDELLDRAVDVVVLDEVPDEIARARLLRRLRRGVREPDPWISPIVDSGSVDSRPFLVVPSTGRGTLAKAPPLPPESVVVLALHLVEAVTALRQRGLAPLPLRPELVRIGPEGKVQLVAGQPWPAGPGDGPGEDVDPGVRQVGELMGELLEHSSRAGQGAGPGRGVARLQAVAARAAGTAAPALSELRQLREELVAWQDARALEASARPAAEAAPARPEEQQREGEPQPASEPTTVVLALRGGERDEPPTAPLQRAAGPVAPLDAEDPTEPVPGPRPAAPAAPAAATGGADEAPALHAAEDPTTETMYVPLASLLGDTEDELPDVPEFPHGTDPAGRVRLLRRRRFGGHGEGHGEGHEDGYGDGQRDGPDDGHGHLLGDAPGGRLAEQDDGPTVDSTRGL